MTIKARLAEFLDGLPEQDISGWQLFDYMLSATRRNTYPATLLQYAREYADRAGGEFRCVDLGKSIYHYVPGIKIAGTIID